MSTRRPPLPPEALMRRWATSLTPGAIAGRLASPSPIALTSRQKAVARVLAAQPVVSAVGFQRDTWTVVNGAQNLTLTYLPITGSLHFYVNGVYQQEGVDYTRSGTTISVLAAANMRSGDIVEARYAYLSAAPNTPATVTGAPDYVSLLGTNGTLPFTASLPTSLAGQLIYVAVVQRGATAFDTPAGWTQHDSVVANTFAEIAVFSKVSDGATTTFAVSAGASTVHARAVAVIYDSGTVQTTANASGASNPWSQPTLATTPTRRIIYATVLQSGPTGVSGAGLSLGADVTLRDNLGSWGTQNEPFAVGDFVANVTGTSPAETGSNPSGFTNWGTVAVSIG